MNKPNICLSGNGWGAIAEYESLSKIHPGIQIATNDIDLIAKLRPTDIQLADIDSAQANIFVCAGHKSIISVEKIRKSTFINVHYSLLPKYRGMHSTVWAILNGEEHSGCTIHLMNQHIDDGPILEQFRTVISQRTSREIMIECNQWVANNLDRVITDYVNGKIIPQVQDKSLATWVPKRNILDCFIDFNSTTVEIDRVLRALVDPYPLPRFNHRGIIYEISKARVIYRPYFCTAGRVVNIDGDGVWIKLRDGLLVVSELRSNGESISTSELKIGARLND